MSRYGCHNLKLGDKDGAATSDGVHIWGGTRNSPQTLCDDTVTVNANTGVNNVVAINQYVMQLQQDLRRLGFLLVGTPDGSFGRATQFALREFQIYAKMEQVAAIKNDTEENERVSAHLMASRGQRANVIPRRSVYVDTLESVTNDSVYDGPICGELNDATATALEHWLDNEYRCPVIIEIWETDPASSAATNLMGNAVNLWYQNEVPHHGSTRLFFRDFTNYYTWPTDEDGNAVYNQEMMQPLGERQGWSGYMGGVSEPKENGSTVWPEGEITPQNLIGIEPNNMTEAQQSTFRVIRAVSEVECLGYFDSINTYDNAYVSVGPCHWTLGIHDTNNSTISDGELSAFLAYLKSTDEDSFEQAIGFFGIDVSEDWQDNGMNLYSYAQKKYMTWVSHQQGSSDYQEIDRADDVGVNTRHEADIFKTWHWFYRFVMAGRTIEGYRHRMWDMARTRLRDIRAAAWGSQTITIPNIGDFVVPDNATVGGIFTSEKAMALILRWHVRAPADVVRANRVGTALRNALSNAIINNPGLTWLATEITNWGDEFQTAITDALYTQCQESTRGGVADTTLYINNWPSWTGTNSNPRRYQLDHPLLIQPLGSEADSFELDEAGLP